MSCLFDTSFYLRAFCHHLQVIYEDLPANLCAIRDRVELLESNILRNSRSFTSEPKKFDKQELREEDTVKEDEAESGRRDSPKRIPKRPLVVGLQRNFNILEQELLKFIAEKVRFHTSCTFLYTLMRVD